MKSVNHEELGQLIEVYYRHKKALMIYGNFGIGKSYVVRSKGIEIAERKNRKFVEWNKLTQAEKSDVFKSPEKYFVLLDIRLSESDPSDVKGLPSLSSDTYIDWLPPQYAKVLENIKSDGILFFDEINLATQLVVSSVYKILYDRIINETKISDNWFIAAAGNLDEDRAYTHHLAPPVRDRGGEVVLERPSSEDWVKWAASSKVDSRIIGYISWQKHKLYYVNHEDEQKFTTPRGWERLSNLISDVIDDYNELLLISSSAISESIASEFTAFCKL